MFEIKNAIMQMPDQSKAKELVEETSEETPVFAEEPLPDSAEAPETDVKEEKQE